MKKIVAIVLALTLLIALGATAIASSSTLNWKDGFGFHCNAGKGNGKVVTGFEKATIGLTRVAGTTTWNLDINVNNVCPSCQRIDWVTFSNNNGVINGKNIQVNHSANPVYRAEASAELVLIDIVLDCEGELVSKNVKKESQSGVFATNNPAVFNFNIPAGYEIVKGSNPVVINFEAKAGQNLSGKVVAEKVTILECNCTGNFFNDPPVIPEPCKHPAIVCDNCKNSNGSSHDQCIEKPDSNENKNTNFFCLDCNEKVGSASKNDPGRLTCSCACNG